MYLWDWQLFTQAQCFHPQCLSVSLPRLALQSNSHLTPRAAASELRTAARSTGHSTATYIIPVF